MVISFMGTVYAAEVEITEVELNPEGRDSGNEWVELFSEEEIDLEGWYLKNGDGDRYNLSVLIDGYEIITFDSQWLDNNEEFVILYNGDNEKIDETDELKDDDDDESTWQICERDWIFLDEDTRRSPSEDHEDCDKPEKEEEKKEIAYIPRNPQGNSALEETVEKVVFQEIKKREDCFEFTYRRN